MWAISTVGLHIELQRHTPVGSTIGPAIFEAYALGVYLVISWSSPLAPLPREARASSVVSTQTLAWCACPFLL